MFICGVHHGGRMYGNIFSMVVAVYSGNLATMFSRFDMNLVGDFAGDSTLYPFCEWMFIG